MFHAKGRRNVDRGRLTVDREEEILSTNPGAPRLNSKQIQIEKLLKLKTKK